VAVRKKGPARRAKPDTESARRWSAQVMRNSDAMDLQAGVFKLGTPAAVARSLKRSAEASHRRKSTPFRSAMSMLNFEINRGGKNLSRERLQVLEQAKQELRKLFGRPLK
jgi:hypothetical protein